MTHRGAPPEKLPTLTEVIEYDGEVMTVRTLAEAAPDRHNACAWLGAAGGDTLTGAVLRPSPALDEQAVQQLLDAVRQQIEQSLEQRLQAVLGPLFEQAAEQAAGVSRRLLTEALRDAAASWTAGRVQVSAPPRPHALDDSGDAAAA